MSDDISIPSPTYRVPRHSRGMDPATRRLALIAAGIGGTLLVVVGGWDALSHRSSGVPVVQAEPGPMRVKPANPGGLQVAGVNNDIFSGGSDTDVEKLAPPPQTPDPQALRRPPAPAAAAAPPTERAVVAAPAESPAATAPTERSAAAEPVRRPDAAPSTPEHAAVAAMQPRPGPMPASDARAPVATVAPPARPLDNPVAVAAAAHPAGNRNVLVQLAALSSEPAAKAEWDRLARRWPDLFGGHRPAFSKIERGGQTFWRVRTGGFDGVTQATMFCERLRAKGGGCSVADF